MSNKNSKTLKFVAGITFALALVIGSSASAAITSQLKQGSRNSQVLELQQFLNNCSAETMVSASGAGSKGMETSYFGPATKRAVIAFQNKMGVKTTSYSAGLVGPATRAAIAAGCGTNNNNNNNNTPITGTISSSLATDTPGSMTLATGTASNSVLKVSIANGSTSSISVKGIKVSKTGYVNNTKVSGVSAYDASGVRHGNVVTTLGADGVATLTFVTDPIMIGAGQTGTVLIKANLTSGAYSGTIGFGVANPATDIMLVAGTVSGSAISGNLMSIVDGSSNLPTVTLDIQPVNTSGLTVNADGVSAYEITKFRIRETSSNEDIKFYSLTLWNNGNAADSDVTSLELLDQTGNVIATGTMMNKYVTFTPTTPYLITKGQTKDFTVRGKFVNGASRTVQFVAYNDYDLDVRGVTTTASILSTPGASVDSTFPIGDTTSTYNKVTVGSGSMVFSRATDSPSTSVTPGAGDVVLAKFNAKPIGESVELRAISFGIDQNTGSVNLTGTVYVKVNGSVVYSAAATTSNFAADGTVATRSLSSYPILTAGVNNVIEISASIDSSATTSDAYFVNDLDLTSVKRLITNDITDPTVSTQDGYTRSVQAAALVVDTLTTPVATSVVAGTNDHKFATFEFNAQSSGEDVRVSSVTVTDTLGLTGDWSGVSNLVMKDSAGTPIVTTASTSTNATTVAFNFATPITVTRTSPTSISLYGDVLSDIGTTHTFKIASASHVTSTGAATGNSITETGFAGTGQAMTVVSGGTLTLSNATGTGYTPSIAQNVTINQADGIYLAGRFTSQYEAQKITSLTLEAAGTALNGNNIKNIRLYAQTGTGALLGTTTPFQTISAFSSCSSNVCSYTWTSNDNILPMAINPGTQVTLFVKADIQGEGTAKLGNDFYFRVQNGADIVAKGAVTQTTTTESGNFNDASTAVSYITPFQVIASAEYPTSTTLSSVGAGTVIGRFKVINNGSAQVTLTDATFTDSGSHTGTSARYTVYASSENSNNYTTTLLETSSTDTVAFGSLSTSVTINGGAYRYITVTASTVTGVASGDTFSLSVASLGDLKYSVTEANLGYDAEQDGDITGTITGLYLDGKPSLSVIQKQ
jgi:hypothetical protein